jgi:hypothetical protein
MESTTRRSRSAIRLSARLEGLMTDPVYEGKSMQGMIALVRKGFFPSGSKILYAHLGGVPAINAYSYLYRNGQHALPTLQVGPVTDPPCAVEWSARPSSTERRPGRVGLVLASLIFGVDRDDVRLGPSSEGSQGVRRVARVAAAQAASAPGCGRWWTVRRRRVQRVRLGCRCRGRAARADALAWFGFNFGCLPRSRPLALATFIPPRVRIRIRSVSNSATMASTLNSSRPTGRGSSRRG